MADPSWTVGQEVILRDYRRVSNHGPNPDRTVRVTRVGRTYVYIDPYGNGHRELAYRFDGTPKPGDGGWDTRIGTAEMFAADDARSAAERRLSDLTSTYGWMRGVSTEVITQIADLIEGATGESCG